MTGPLFLDPDSDLNHYEGILDPNDPEDQKTHAILKADLQAEQ